MTMYLVLSVLATTKDYVFSFTVCMFLPSMLTYSAKTKSGVYHLIPSHPGLPEPS